MALHNTSPLFIHNIIYLLPSLFPHCPKKHLVLALRDWGMTLNDIGINDGTLKRYLTRKWLYKKERIEFKKRKIQKIGYLTSGNPRYPSFLN